ncbi:MAG: hypothetical protein CVV47_07025 [Spirochaetae bacterium HGW-Spirochaetae-3]|jgi:ATP-dependent protease ClpP protease subunit|nr:MAG: hypothetical protein CVV47_07025 [Spirochaetae bacterium HGW-Spirochaetae-3]
MTKKWYAIADNEKADTAEISIYDEIGFWGTTFVQFAEDFNKIKNRSSIKLYLNSVGGSVFDGLGIYNLLSSVHDRLTVEVMGLAASISSVIFLAGDIRIMDEGTFLMVHLPSVSTSGGSDDLRKDADTLDKIKEEIVNIYVNRTGMAQDTITKLMEAETWFTADEAVKNGFATVTNKQAQATNCLYNLTSRGFVNVPKNLSRPAVTIADMTVRDFEKTLRDVGFSKSEATLLASKFGAEKIDERESQGSLSAEAYEQLSKIFE